MDKESFKGKKKRNRTFFLIMKEQNSKAIVSVCNDIFLILLKGRTVVMIVGIMVYNF